MSYLSSPYRASRVPGARGMGALEQALGDAAAEIGKLVPTSSLSGADAIRELQRQVNRYTLAGGAPINLRFGTEPVPVTGALDDVTITRAITIMQLRAGMAHIQWNDGATKELLDEVRSAWSAPRAFVTKNINRLIDIIKLFGDKMHVPPAKGAVSTKTMGALAVAALGVLYVVTRKKRR